MKFKSPIFSQASGSLAGMTFTRNRGGMIVRARAIPTNPNSPQQQVVRGDFAQLAGLWVDVLTPAERDAWDEYASQVLIPDTLGEPRNIGGLGQYQRSNVGRLQASLPRVDAAPTIFDIGSYTNPTIASITASTDLLSLNFTAGDAWPDEDDAAMLVYTSRGQNPSINYFKGPYRFAAAILGNATTAPTSPASIALAFGVAVGQRVFIRVNVTRADGRLAADFRNFDLSV